TATSWQNPEDLPPSKNGGPTQGTWTLTNGQTELTKEAGSELLQLQAGQPFPFLGHDFTPGGWFGPGPISVPQTLTGKSSSFYTILPNTHIDENALYRHTPYPGYYDIYNTRIVGPGYWHSYVKLEGDT